MGYLKFLKSKKILLSAAGVVVVVGIAGFVFYSQKLPTYNLSIKPTELSPFVSRKQARETICSRMKGPLFDEACQQTFDRVGKNDAEKIGALFSLLKKIESDRSISDYDRLLLAQAVFASLPTKDSPLAKSSGFSDSLARIKNFIGETKIAYAQELPGALAQNKEEFIKQMLADLKAVVDTNLPGEDNAWVLHVAVTKLAWVHGERQPIYSEEYGEGFDPYSDIITTTGEQLENKGNYEKYLSVHVRSITSNYATNKAMYSGPLKEGSGEMIAYSFSIESWQSKPYGADSALVLAEAGPGERYNSSRHTYTEENYKGDDMMSELFSTVKMPSREGRTAKPQEKTVSPEKITQTVWGGPDEETAYELYFWLHLQQPNLYPNFWDVYNFKNSAVSEAMRQLPIGEPVNLRDYYSDPKVRENHQQLQANPNVPTLENFLNNIDQYQMNLNLSQSTGDQSSTAETPTGQPNQQVESFDRWLKECASRPLPQTRAELEERELQDSNPSSPCYNPGP